MVGVTIKIQALLVSVVLLPILLRSPFFRRLECEP